jgi:hypothetical protein
MGQYQKWLEYQEIHKRLSSQVEALKAEITKLQDYANQFEQQHSLVSFESFVENPIVQALVAHLPFQAVPPQNTIHSPFEEMNSAEPCAGEPGDTISPALRRWGGLPDFEIYEIKETLPQDNQSPSFLNHPEMALLPEDMMAFFNEHEQTDPQLELPWWLRKITISSKDEQSSKPIDYNTVRTNRLVQRWVERWGRNSTTALRSDENTEENTHE